MNKFRKVIVVLSCFGGLIVLITVLSQFSWFPKAVQVQSVEKITPSAELDKTKVSPIFLDAFIDEREVGSITVEVK